MQEWHGLMEILPGEWQKNLIQTPADLLKQVQELRIREGQPILAYGIFGEKALSKQGLVSGLEGAARAQPTQIMHLLATISQNSIYALEAELRQGYVTIAGGHRIGLSGKAIVEDGLVRTLKYIKGFNIRLARQVPGCADKLLPQLFDCQNRLQSTLLVAAPQGGKTTMLRDLTRSLSLGRHTVGHKVVVVDERSEIAACYQGVPQLDLGPRVDVLDACPKAEGMMMALRSLSPQVLVTDEIGRREDVVAILEALHAGVAVLATAHGNDYAELLARPVLRELLVANSFQRYVFMSTRLGPGTIEAVLPAAELKGGFNDDKAY